MRLVEINYDWDNQPIIKLDVVVEVSFKPTSEYGEAMVYNYPTHHYVTARKSIDAIMFCNPFGDL